MQRNGSLAKGDRHFKLVSIFVVLTSLAIS